MHITPWSLYEEDSHLKRQRREQIGSPLVKTIFDVVERGIDEDSGVVPCTRLDSDRFMNEAVLRKVPVRNGYS